MGFGSRRKRRASGEIDKLPAELRDTVDQMLLSGEPYRSIVEYLAKNSVQLSQMTVCRYAKRYLANVEQMKLSRENMRMLMEEMDKYPDIDTSEAILQISMQNAYNAISAVPEEGWESISPDKLLKQTTALIRAAGYKKQVDQRLQTDTEKAMAANQTLLFDVLSKRHPELYSQIMEVIKKEALQS